MLGFLIEWLRSLLFTRHLDVCIVGLPGAGKTTLTNVLVTGRVPEHVAPTVGYNLRQLRVGNVRMRLWDIGYVFILTQWPAAFPVNVGAVLLRCIGGGLCGRLEHPPAARLLDQRPGRVL